MEPWIRTSAWNFKSAWYNNRTKWRSYSCQEKNTQPNSRPRSSCRYCKATKNQNHPSNGWFWFPYQREIYGFRSAADSHTEGSHRENPCGRKNSNGIPKWHGLRTWWLWICRINSNLTSRRFGEEFQYLLSKISCKKVVPSALHELLRSQSLSANPFDWEVSYKPYAFTDQQIPPSAIRTRIPVVVPS